MRLFKLFYPITSLLFHSLYTKTIIPIGNNMPIGIIHNISTFSKKLALLRLQSIINLTILRTMDEQHIYILPFCIAKRYILPKTNILMLVFQDSNSRKRQQISAVTSLSQLRQCLSTSLQPRCNNTAVPLQPKSNDIGYEC